MQTTPVQQVKVLAFDVFGTVVDYRSTIIREGEQFNRSKGLTVDWARFADEWRGRYRPSMQRVMSGDLPWTKLDVLHRMSLDELLAEFHITNFSEEEKVHLNKVWHRLIPWPDSVPGLTRLRERFILATLSNGNVALLTHMAKYSSLPWDCIFSAELVRAYKPDPRTYRMTFELLDVQPSEVMMVAAHQDDLLAAAAQGLRTAFIPRPSEHGPHAVVDLTPDPAFTVVARDMLDLAQQLGA